MSGEEDHDGSGKEGLYQEEFEKVYEEEFEKACLYVRGISGKLSNEDLLFFYARFKQELHPTASV